MNKSFLNICCDDIFIVALNDYNIYIQNDISSERVIR